MLIVIMQFVKTNKYKQVIYAIKRDLLLNLYLNIDEERNRYVKITKI